jgi:hypothetical protein
VPASFAKKHFTQIRKGYNECKEQREEKTKKYLPCLFADFFSLRFCTSAPLRDDVLASEASPHHEQSERKLQHNVKYRNS